MSPLLLVPQDMILALVECAGGNDILLIVVLFFFVFFCFIVQLLYANSRKWENFSINFLTDLQC